MMLARMLARLRVRPRSHGSRHVGKEQQTIALAREAIACGKPDEAERLLRLLLDSTEPVSTQARRLLGSLLGSRGQLAEARELLEVALMAEPDHPEALTDLGNVCRSSGRAADAVAHYRRAIALDPNARTARFNLAVMRGQAGERAAAIDDLGTLLEAPAHADALRTALDWLCEDAREHAAKALCERVLRAEPQHPAAHAGMRALLLRCAVTPAEAFAHADAAYATGCNDPEVLLNRAIALQFLGRQDEALAAYELGLALRPEATLIRFHRALALLSSGDFQRAWPDYELRLMSRDLPPPPRSLRRWQGEPLPDRTLLVYGEQGIGDEIMFASCIPSLLERCPRIVLACAVRLVPIMQRSFPQVLVMNKSQVSGEMQCALLDRASIMAAIGSLPRYLRNSIEDFPRQGGYLRADPELIAHYRARLGRLPPGPKIGFSWRGGSAQSRQSLRSLGATEVAALLESRDVQFVNLQHDSTGDEPEIAGAVASGRLLHWPEALIDYEHTAALVCALDLTLSVCTAVVHLAGALGRDVLIMAPYSPEWRYGIAGTAMPWYPSATILRQPEPGVWTRVIAEARARLRAVGA